MKTTTTTTTFTTDELRLVGRSAQAVWNEIAGDVLDACGGASATVSKRDVIEMVMDASRLEGAVGRAVARSVKSGEMTTESGADLVARVERDVYATPSVIERHLKTDVFRFARYGN